jgi:hypothetical protein
LINGPAGHHLGLGTWHEDARPYDDLDSAEMSAAGQMLDRNAFDPLHDQLAIATNMIIVEFVEQRQLGQLDAGYEGQQDASVLCRRFDACLAKPIRCLR